MRQAVQEVGGAVEGIDDPTPVAIGALDHATLLQQEAEARPRSLELLDQDPLGPAVGGVVGLWALNLFVMQPLDVLTMLGFIILIGVVVNNAILIIYQTLLHIREDGMFYRDAILESVRNRIRPIFMSTFTSIFGLMPLVVIPGAGSEIYRGIGVVILSGLFLSTIFTLLLIPCLMNLSFGMSSGPGTPVTPAGGGRRTAPAPGKALEGMLNRSSRT